MDPLERSVLRRKVYLLKEVLPLEDKLFDECKKQGLFGDEETKKIMSTSPEHEAYCVFIKCLEEQGKATFNKICYLLERRGLHAAADEFQAELLLAKKELKAETWCLKETKCRLQKLVDSGEYRQIISDEQIGDEAIKETTRGGLKDTKLQSDLVEFAASRYLVGLETWKRQYNRKRNIIQREKQTVLAGVVDIAKEIESMVNEKAAQFGQTIKWPETDYNNQIIPHQAAFGNLRKRMAIMSQFVDELLKEYMKLHRDKDACLKMLGIPDTNDELNGRLELYISKSHEELTRTKGDLKNKSDSVKLLHSQIEKLKTEMRHQLLVKQHVIADLEDRVNERENKVKTLEKEILKTIHSDDITKAQLEYWKQRCTILQKTRSLGYYPKNLKNSDTRNKDIAELKAVAMAEIEKAEKREHRVQRNNPESPGSTFDLGTITPLSLSRPSSGFSRTGASTDPLILPHVPPRQGLAVGVKTPSECIQKNSSVPYKGKFEEQ